MEGSKDASPSLEVTNVTKRFDIDRQAVSQLSFRVQPGEIYALLGGPGAGKTTVLDMILGVLAPTSGQVVALGKPIRVGHHSGGVCVVTSSGKPPALTPVEFIRLLVALDPDRGRPARVAATNALRAMLVPEARMHTFLTKLPATIGLAVGLAAALLRESRLVLLDEPARGAEDGVADELRRRLRVLTDAGAAVVVATRSMLLACQISDRVAVIHDGQLIAERTRYQLMNQTIIELYAGYVSRARDGRIAGRD